MSAGLLLARHGETEWNATHRWQGSTGPPLNALGREQARALSERLAAVELGAIYSSTAIRALETASAVAEPRSLEVHRDPRLGEVDFGEWEGLTRQEINERHADAFDAWDACKLAAPTGGETDLEMAERVVEALTEIASRHARERVLVVTSGGPIRAVEAHAAGVDQSIARLHFPRAENCAVLEVEVDEGRFSVGESC
jgi:probable phosphoglycerate mutase